MYTERNRLEEERRGGEWGKEEKGLEEERRGGEWGKEEKGLEKERRGEWGKEEKGLEEQRRGEWGKEEKELGIVNNSVLNGTDMRQHEIPSDQQWFPLIELAGYGASHIHQYAVLGSVPAVLATASYPSPYEI